MFGFLCNPLWESFLFLVKEKDRACLTYSHMSGVHVGVPRKPSDARKTTHRVGTISRAKPKPSVPFSPLKDCSPYGPTNQQVCPCIPCGSVGEMAQIHNPCRLSIAPSPQVPAPIADLAGQVVQDRICQRQPAERDGLEGRLYSVLFVDSATATLQPFEQSQFPET